MGQYTRSHTCYKNLFPFSITCVTQPSFHLSAFALSFSCPKMMIIKQNAASGNKTNDINWQIHGLPDAVTRLPPPFEIGDQVNSLILKEKTDECSFHCVFTECITPNDCSETAASRGRGSVAPTAACRPPMQC